MDECTGETWLFTAHAEDAELAYLVVDSAISPSRWIKMRPIESVPGAWRAVTELSPGLNRVRYFVVEDGAYLNCGTVGLTGERTSANDPAVQIENLDLAA